MRRLAIAVAISLFAFASVARAVVYSEAASGDLSNNGNAPTNLGTFTAGTHQVISSSTFPDVDDYTFAIPAGLTLTAITPTAYTGLDETAFLGLQAGSTIDNSGASLMGYQHFGPAQGNMNTNLLPFISAGPLGPGSYTVWTQQQGSLATYTIDFVVTPEPGSAATIALLTLAFTTARGPRRAARA